MARSVRDPNSGDACECTSGRSIQRLTKAIVPGHQDKALGSFIPLHELCHLIASICDDLGGYVEIAVELVNAAYERLVGDAANEPRHVRGLPMKQKKFNMKTNVRRSLDSEGSCNEDRHVLVDKVPHRLSRHFPTDLTDGGRESLKTLGFRRGCESRQAEPTCATKADP